MDVSKPKTAWIIPVIAIVSLFGIFTWQLGVFNMGSSSMTATGFAKIKPQLAGLSVTSNGQIRAVFTNGVGTTIIVKSVEFEDYYGKKCYASLTRTQVLAGENFQTTASGCTIGYAGDVYNIKTKIDYEATVGAITTTHTEMGTLRGPLEGNQYYSSEYRPGTGYYGGYYGQSMLHKSFDFGGWWVVVILLSIVSVLSVYKNLSKLTSSTSVQLSGLYGFIFLLCSTLIFIFGLDHFFNTLPRMADNSYMAEMPLRLKYGWAIESAIYFIVGAILVAIAEYKIKKVEKQNTSVPPVIKPIATLIVLALILVYPLRAITSTMAMHAETKLLELGWIAEILLLCITALAYSLINREISRGTRFQDEQPDVLYYTKSISYLYFIVAAGFFIWGVNSLIYSSAGLDFRGILTSVFMVVGGLVLLKVNKEKKAMKTEAKRHDATVP